MICGFILHSVEINGHDGKAGMAALVGDIDDEKLADIVKTLKSNLQDQSVPIFYRQVEAIPKTANFKAKKVELAAEGYNGDHTWILYEGKLVPMTEDIKSKLSTMKL